MPKPVRKKYSVDSIARRPQSLQQASVKSTDHANEAVKVAVRKAGFNNRKFKKVPVEYESLDKPKRGNAGFLIFLFLLLTVTVAGYFYWNEQYTNFQGDSVFLEVTAPKTITSGDEVTFALTYENQDIVTLRTVELNVQWPDNFYFNQATLDPNSEAATTWNLGPLEPGQKKRIEISGQMIGLEDEKLSVIFRLNYRPENISSDFEVVEIVDVVISQAQIGLTLQSDPKVLAGSQSVLTAVLTNLTPDALNNVIVDVIVPKDLTLEDSDPELVDTRWTGDLAAGASQTFQITAKAAADGNGKQPWVLEIGQQFDDSLRRLLRKESVINVVRPEFNLSLKVNGQSNELETDFGKSLSYQLVITNLSTSAMDGLKVTALMDSDVLNRASLQANGKVDKDTIVWTRNDTAELGTIESGAEVLIPWSINLLPSAVSGRSTVDTVVTLELEGLPDWNQTTPVYVISVGEGLVFNQGLYFDLGGIAVGSGNLPPVTNERTIYLVIWSLDAGSQDFASVNLSTFMAPKVEYVEADSADEGVLNFDEETNRLEWQIDDFSNQLLPMQASFFVKLVPEDEDAGAVMTVINPVTIVASGNSVFQSKSFSLKTNQVIADNEDEEDLGTVIE